MTKPKKMNILLLMADQLAAQALGLYGNKVCRTPNLDRLASEGTVFSYPYSNNPLCVPSRASMLSGMLTPRIGVYDNANELPISVPTMAHYLRHAGYWTVLSGKMHFIGPDQLHGFNERTTTDVYPANFQWIADWSAGPSFVPSGTALNGVVEAGPCIRSMQEDYDDEVEYQATQNLYDRARAPDRKPFFHIVSFTSPHTPFVVAREYWDRYSDDEIDVPRVEEIPFEQLDYFSKALFFAHGRHRHRVTPDHIRACRRAYYGMISYIDDKVGRLLDTLEKIGERENTAIFFVSDHGEMLGERGMWFKQAFWDWSARIPMIASVPGLKQPARCDRITSLVDLLPTFMEIAGIADMPRPLPIDGNSLMPLLRGEEETWPDLAVSDYLAIGPCVPTRMVRKGRFKLIYTLGHPSLLFDMVVDPDELRDLSGDPAYGDTLAELEGIALDGWDPDALAAKVMASQQARKLIASAPGEAPKWDFLARMNDDHRYVRVEGVDATKGRLRLPHVAAAPSDWPALDERTISDLMSGRRKLADVLG